MSFINELKRRNVFRVGIAYAVAAWIILQATDVIGEILDLPQWGAKLILVMLGVGFVLALFFAWAFELTPEGVKRESEVDRSTSIAPQTGKKLNAAIMVMLAVGLAYFVWESRFMSRQADEAGQANDAPIEAAAPGVAASGADTDANGLKPASAAPVTGTVDEKSIAVLPFTNRSPNEDDIYFTDGVHDDLLTQLAKLNAFSVISRTSVMEYRDTSKKIRDIARELGVANIMEGAVQRAGNQVRITVQLIDAETDEHLWAEVYDRALTTENLFEIQSEIARAIAVALQATLSDEQLASVAQAPTNNVEAYELYQQARRFALGETEIGYSSAIELYKEALTLDPAFALAWIGLAKAHITNFWLYAGDPQDRLEAREAIDRARALDADLPELFVAEGFYWYWGYLDYDRAIENLEQAVALMPGNAEAHMWLGWARRRDGQWNAAIDSMRESLRLDPRVMLHWAELSATLALVKRQDEALEAAQTAFELSPDNYWSRWVLGEQLARMTGNTDRLIRLLIGAQHSGDSSFVNFYIEANILARQFDEALEALAQYTEEMEVSRVRIAFREQVRARILMLAGRESEAHEQARLALGRLDELAKKIPDDYRLSEARANLFSVLGDREETLASVRQTFSSQPEDAVDEAVIRYTLAKCLAMAGLNAEAIELLDEHLGSPGYETAAILRIDPALDRLRDDPAFAQMLERHP